MTEKYRVNDWVKFQYSEIGEYIGEGYTDRPLRNDILVGLLNEQTEEIEYWKKEAKNLSEENKQLKKEKEYYKRELQKDLVCQAIIDGREKNDSKTI